MDYILVGSPDKLILASFARYLIKAFGDLLLGDMHYLMSEEAKDLFVEDFCNKNHKGVFTYYIKRPPQNVDPLTYLPKKAINVSEVVIWFDLYATEPSLIKDSNSVMAPILEQWKSYIAKLGG